ncbi:hypothetical protein ET445_02245 [Agromyces protaetiae]|uniref:Uncharacterized protein n=1 Tax=Agromyces protaetiae TaxID=2509455 RepID=A0A4P6F8A8_9MICO|nr:DUF6766 family protein [Agromyces protaetiae]QAY72330.1 hypothetical protein ET445_02245 [Agromyces protaetiae]
MTFARWLREHSLFTVTFALFVVFFAGMAVSGFAVYNDDQLEHGLAPIGFFAYLGSGAFGEAVFENWESEFLQMGAYVVLTIFLIQKGSSESKPPGERVPQDDDPREAKVGPKTPWPVRRGGFWLVVYENSLAILFFVLFGASVLLHAATGAAAYSEDRAAHGLPPVGMWEYLGTSQFWFESMQNWQSEFLAVAALVLASVYLRQRGSPESKPVAAPHGETG